MRKRRPRHADRHSRAPQALRGYSVEVLDFIDGYVFLARRRPIHRPQSRLAAQAICRDVEDAFLRRARRLCRGGNQLWTARATMAASSTAAAPSAASSWSIWAKRSPRRSRQFRARARRISSPMKARREGAEGGGGNLRRGKDYFVLNGTSSSSNKIVLTNLVAEDDLVLFDRNKSQGGASWRAAAGRRRADLPFHRPQRLWADRPDASRGVDENPPARTHPRQSAGEGQDAWKRERPFRAAGDRAMHL